MHIGFKAGERGIEFTSELQIIDDALVEALAWNKQRNARRVRGQQHTRYAAFKFVDADALGFPVGHLGVGVRRLHGRNHVAKINLGRQAGQIRSEEHTSELQSLMRISYAVFCLKKKKRTTQQTVTYTHNAQI